MHSLSQSLTATAGLLRLSKDKDHGITFIASADKQIFISYAEFIDHVRFCLYNLRLRGVSPGDELVIQVEDARSFLIAFWAAILGKIIPVPVAVGSQADQKKKAFRIWPQLSKPWLVADTQVLKNLQRLEDDDPLPVRGMIQNFLGVEELLACRQRCDDNMVVNARDIAYVQYSSGSTGMPKGVLLTHANLCANVNAILKRSATTSRDSMLSWMPLSHDMGMICFHMCGIFSGVSQYIMHTGVFIRRPLLWMQIASERKVTQLYSPNFGQQFFLTAMKKTQSPQWDLSSVRIMFNGAEQISPKVCRHFLDALRPFGLDSRIMYPAYGLAEASVAVSLPNPGDEMRTYAVERTTLVRGAPVIFSEDATATRFVEVGYAIEDCEVRITHNDKALPEQYLGDIQIRGKNVTQGYYRFPAHADQLFTLDGWLKTGDLGFMVSGRLVFTGRTKNVIIINSQNYLPHDLEDILLDIPGIELSKLVVTSVWNDRTQKEELLVFVNYKANLEDFLPLKHMITQTLLTSVGLSAHRVIPVRKIPKTTSGKVQHYLLTEAYLAGKYDEVMEQLTRSINI